MPSFDPTTLPPEAQEYLNERVSAVNTAKATILNEKKSLQDEIDALGGLDTLKELKSKIAKDAEDAEKLRVSKLDTDGKLKDTEEKYKLQIKDREERIARLEAASIAREVDLRVTQAIAEAEGNPALLTEVIKKRVQAKMNDSGEVELTVLSADGKSVDSKGNALTLNSVLADLKANDAYAGGFSAKAITGGGARNGGDGNAGDGTRPDSPSERQAYIARKYKLK